MVARVCSRAPCSPATDVCFTNEVRHVACVVAQQLRQHMPSLVHETADHSLSVEYQGLIPLLLASLQDAHQRIAALENVVAHIPLCYE